MATTPLHSDRRMDQDKVAEYQRVLGPSVLASLFHIVDLARTRYLKIDQFIPENTWIEPITFKFEDMSKTQTACLFLGELGYGVVFDPEKNIGRLLVLSPEHFPPGASTITLEVEDMIDPADDVY